MTNNPIMLSDGHFHEMTEFLAINPIVELIKAAKIVGVDLDFGDLPQSKLNVNEHLRDITQAEIDAEWEEYRRTALENEKET